MSVILIIILVILAFGAFGSYPGWSHSQGWGYAPFGGILGLLLLVLVIYLLLGHSI